MSEREAIQAFGELMDVLKAPDESRRAQYEAVVSEVARLAKAAGLHTTLTSEGLQIHWTSRRHNRELSLLVSVESAAGGFDVLLREGNMSSGIPYKETRVPLRYDHVSKLVTGAEFDQDVAPVPGEPLQYRGAVAVVAQTVVERLRAQLSPAQQ